MQFHVGVDTTILPSTDLKYQTLKDWNWKHSYITEPKVTMDTGTRLTWLLASSKHNIECATLCLNHLISVSRRQVLVDNLFYRLPTDLLPNYTLSWNKWIYDRIEKDLLKPLHKLGELARKNNIRLTFHAPMTCVLNSTNPQVVLNSKFALERLINLYRLMGYSIDKFHDCGIGITTHIGGASGGIANYVQACEPYYKNVIQVENDDKLYNTRSLLEVFYQTGIPICMDLHHEWCTNSYIDASSELVCKVKDTWGSVRPKLHLSMSSKELLTPIYGDIEVKGKVFNSELPDKKLCNKVPFSKFRTHGELIYGSAMKNYILNFITDFDVMVEMRGYNIASEKLAEWLDNKLLGLE